MCVFRSYYIMTYLLTHMFLLFLLWSYYSVTFTCHSFNSLVSYWPFTIIHNRFLYIFCITTHLYTTMTSIIIIQLPIITFYLRIIDSRITIINPHSNHFRLPWGFQKIHAHYVMYAVSIVTYTAWIVWSITHYSLLWACLTKFTMFINTLSNFVRQVYKPM